MRRLYGDMSFQVTRPNGTKSNAIVEVITLNRPWKLPRILVLEDLPINVH